MKRIIAIAALLSFAAALPAAAQRRAGPHDWAPNTFRFSAGVFTPDGDSEYWQSNELDFTGDAADFEDFTGGFDYLRALSPRLSLMASYGYYEGQHDQSYLDFVGPFGESITHTTTLEVASLTGGLVFHLLRRDAAVSPYVGAGGGLYAWTLEESGEFIDFLAEPAEIFSATFRDEGDDFGWYWLAGLDIPLGSGWTVFAEARWSRGEAGLGEDFEGLGDLDLGGRKIVGGASFRF